MPAVQGGVTMSSGELGAARNALEAATLTRKACIRAGQPCRSHASLFLHRDGWTEGTGRAGEHTLDGIAREIAGLLPRGDGRRSHAVAIFDVREVDRLYGTHLNALAALDTSGKEVPLVNGTWRTKTRLVVCHHWQHAEQRGTSHEAARHARPQQLTPVFQRGLPCGICRFGGHGSTRCPIGRPTGRWRGVAQDQQRRGERREAGEEIQCLDDR